MDDQVFFLKIEERAKERGTEDGIKVGEEIQVRNDGSVVRTGDRRDKRDRRQKTSAYLCGVEHGVERKVGSDGREASVLL